MPDDLDIVSQIKSRVDPAAYYLTTAEGRAAFDNALRRELAKIKDSRVRTHAGEMLRLWRWQVFGLPETISTHPFLIGLQRRLESVEAALGIRTPTEITSLREGGADG